MDSHGTARLSELVQGFEDLIGEFGEPLLAVLELLLGVLGLDPLAPPWANADTQGERMREIVQSLVQVALDQRESARARKDFATADALRESLEKAGIVIEDTPTGPRWEVRR